MSKKRSKGDVSKLWPSFSHNCSLLKFFRSLCLKRRRVTTRSTLRIRLILAWQQTSNELSSRPLCACYCLLIQVEHSNSKGRSLFIFLSDIIPYHLHRHMHILKTKRGLLFWEHFMAKYIQYLLYIYTITKHVQSRGFPLKGWHIFMLDLFFLRGYTAERSQRKLLWNQKKGLWNNLRHEWFGQLSNETKAALHHHLTLWVKVSDACDITTNHQSLRTLVFVSSATASQWGITCKPAINGGNN